MLRKLLKYRKLVFLVVIHLVKHQVYRFILSDRNLVNQLMKSYPLKEEPSGDPLAMQLKMRLIRQIDRIMTKLMPGVSCLVRTSVQRDVLAYYGMSAAICIGVKKEEDKFLAHAWLKEDNDQGYTKLVQSL
jgi:hypothetical protein